MGQQADHARKVVLRMSLPDGAMDRLGRAFPEGRFITCAGDQDLDRHLADVEVLIGGQQLSPELARQAPRLRWVQSLSVGMEGFLDLAAQCRGIQVASARGANTTPLAEHALMMMLSFARGMPELSRRQASGQWLPPLSPGTAPSVFELSGSRLGLIGYGRIGRAIAQRAKAFDMDVWALRRSATGEDGGPADRVLGPQGLPDLLAAADHVLVIAPLTPETRGMISSEAFARMKPSAYFYNMSRGAIVDTAALVEALRGRMIAGAGLEVVDPEPLATDSPLWSMENVIITGHTAGLTPRLLDRNIDFLVGQFDRYQRGTRLLNLVDGGIGY